MVALEYLGDGATDFNVPVGDIQSGAMVEVRAAWQAYLGEKLDQRVRLSQGINQQRLLPIGQKLPVDVRVFFKISFALFRRSCSSCKRLIALGGHL